MQDKVFSFDDFNFSAKLIRDLVNAEPSALAFGTPFSLGLIGDQIKQKSFSKMQREILATELLNQNSTIALSEKSKINISAIQDENCFTITTGHQLNIFTGPLFSIYKIAETIRICSDLKVKYPNQHFVPVFWMATEDHDFEEINHLNLFGNKIVWDKTGQEDCIAGRIKLGGIEAAISKIQVLFSQVEQKEKVDSLTKLYLQSQTLAEATRKLVNTLFGEYGLVIIDGDSAPLKKSFYPVISKELESGITFNQVGATNEKLLESGYHNQVHLRECNLFYIHKDGRRDRIRKANDLFLIGDEKFTLADVLIQAEAHPENFSPNALLRPVYQESILPNLAYIGGGGEIAYWLQLKELFHALNVTFPLLKVRDSILILPEKALKSMEELKISVPALKGDLNLIMNQFVTDQSDKDLQLSDAEEELLKAKAIILEKVNQVDKSLEGMVEAEFVRMIKSIEKIEGKLIKAERAKFDQIQKKLESLKDKIFPEGGFQERHENFLSYWTRPEHFIDRIMHIYNPEENSCIRILVQ